MQIQTDAITLIATEMCVVHNIIIRGLNSIYIQANHVKSEDYKAFVGYCLSWHRFVSHHHYSEETGFFTPLQEMLGPSVMAESVEEHRAFHDGLDAYHAYLLSLSGRENDFDGKMLIEIVDSFSATLTKHLNNEIGALLDLQRIERDELIAKAWSDALQKGLSTLRLSDFVTMFPFSFVTHDATYEDGMHKEFPPAPWLMKTMVRNVASRWNVDWWQFGPCNLFGVPKPIYALADE